MKVVVLTTSYPRDEDDIAGGFVRDMVEAVRAEGVDVDVVSPASFPHFGVAYGQGIVGNLRRRPWLALLLPLFFAAFLRAARRATRDADVVHAHWLPAGMVGLATGKPLVFQPWGSDVALFPGLVRLVASRARLVVAASEFLALGNARIVPPPLAVPESVADPEDPPHVLFVGRLAPEKGILEFLEATEGMRRVIVGDGPLRSRVSEAVGFVPPSQLGPYYERAAVVCVPSRREGYGVVAREAMAYGRPVVASAVGGLLDAVKDGSTGVLVPPKDPGSLRLQVARLLTDAGLRQRLGAAARRWALERLDGSSRQLVAVYAEAAEGALPSASA